jgi:choline dehydrogenase
MTFRYFPNGSVEVEKTPGVGVSVYKLRPRTTGTVTLRSADPGQKVVCTTNFLTDAEDNLAVLAGVRKIREIMSSQPMASRVVGEDVPGPGVRTDDEIFRFMQETGNSAMHQGGTCKMGRDPLAVVDERLRVRGMERLRVVDMSIMPTLTSGNTNAPTIMIGVKGADMIRRDATPRRPPAA